MRPPGAATAGRSSRSGAPRAPGSPVSAWPLVGDLVALAVAFGAAQVLRFDYDPDPAHWGRFSLGDLGTVVAGALVVQAVLGLAVGLYRGHWRYGSFDELQHLGAVVAGVVLATSLANSLGRSLLVPRSVPLLAGLAALVLMTTGRYLHRLLDERTRRPTVATSRPVVVLGAGDGGSQIITAMLRSPASPYVPVALLDDDPRKANLSLRGVRVAGTRRDLARVVAATGADTVVVAIPSAGNALLREVSDHAMALGIDVRVLPPIAELFDGRLGVGDIRPLTPNDLLGRHEITTDVASIAHAVTGKRLLVTGAGGSIGSELCRQLSRFGPAELVMVDRNESALHAVELSIRGRALLQTPDLVVADIRDRGRVHEVLERHRPEVVFHAAALKHLPLLEMHPAEAVKTNVWGTQHLLDAATAVGVERFVNISTDKAADPVSVLGYTKRIAERLTTSTATRATGTYLSVRFGNVLGSAGSVLTTFRTQIDEGGPVTVTDPEVTRYFMTVEEAVQLVLQATAVGGSGEALVFDMGAPVRIDEVARRLVAETDRPIEIVYTGLRPGEKRHEVLFGEGEHDRRPVHPLLSHVDVPPLSAGEARAVLAGQGDPDDGDDDAIVGRLARAAAMDSAVPSWSRTRRSS